MTVTQGAAHASHTQDNRAHAKLSCGECHAPVCAPNGSKNVVFGVLAGSRGAVPTYVPSTSTTAATCSNVYCHSKNVVPLQWTYRYSATPPTLAAECSTCHGYPPANHRPTSDCSTCHGTTVLANGTIDLVAGRHINGLVDFSGGGSGTGACNGCHGTTTEDGRPDYASSPSSPNSHGLHPQGCNVCHAGTTTDGTSIADPALHMNGAYDLQAGGGASFTYSFATTGGTCSNISCHGGGSATWGPTASHLATLGEGEVVVFEPGNAQHDGLTMNETCTLCHYASLKQQHAGQCEVCHGGSNPPAAALIGKWDKGCSQCHALIHDGAGVNHHETYWNSTVSCELCHDTSTEFPNPADNCSRCHNPDLTAAAVGDHEAPTTTSNALAVYAGAGTIHLAAIDAGSSGISRTWYSLDGDPWTMGNDVVFDAKARSHNLSFYSVDHATNAEAVKTVGFSVQPPPPPDTTPPTTTSSFNPIAAAAVKASQPVTLTATDAGSGVKTTYYKIDSGSFTPGTSFTVSGDGPHTFSYYSVDNANNTETTHVSNSFRIDTVAPVTTNNAVAGTYTGPQTFTLTANDTGGSGVASTWYKLDGAASFSAGTSVAVAAPLSGSASHTITWYSIDVAGNQEGTKTVTFTVAAALVVDATAPATTSSFNPAAGANFKTNQTVTLTATDAGSGVKATYYKVDSGAFVQETSFTVNGDGVHTFSYYSVDNANNTETTHVSNSFRIDTVAPVTTSDATNGATYTGAKTFTFSATDSGSGVASTWYKLDTAAFVSGNSIAVAAPSSGSVSHTLSWYSIDNAGNQETTKVVTFTVQAAAVVTTTVTLVGTNTSSSNHPYTHFWVNDATDTTTIADGGWSSDEHTTGASFTVLAGVGYVMHVEWEYPDYEGGDTGSDSRPVTPEEEETAVDATVTWSLTLP
jgi:predicted CxxxxCH...CXXCH cytochrome family protein